MERQHTAALTPSGIFGSDHVHPCQETTQISEHWVPEREVKASEGGGMKCKGGSGKLE